MEQRFDTPAIIELFGHSRMAGWVIEHTIGGSTFIRVDVPESENQPGFSRILNPSAIYAINPVTEEVMNEMAKSFSVKPIEQWDIQKLINKLPQKPEDNSELDY